MFTTNSLISNKAIFDDFSYGEELYNEYMNLISNPIEGVIFHVNKNQPRKWVFLIEGPRLSPYEGGVFILNYIIPNEYNNTTPIIILKTKIYHPLMYSELEEYFPYLIDFELRKFVKKFKSELADPFLSAWSLRSLSSVAAECVETPDKFVKNAAEWTKKYAGGEVFKILLQKKVLTMISYNIKIKLYKKVFHRPLIIKEIINKFFYTI